MVSQQHDKSVRFLDTNIIKYLNNIFAIIQLCEHKLLQANERTSNK